MYYVCVMYKYKNIFFVRREGRIVLRSEMQSSNERSLIDLHEKAFTNLSPFSLTILYVCTSILCVIKQFSQITLNIIIIHNTYQYIRLSNILSTGIVKQNLNS